MSRKLEDLFNLPEASSLVETEYISETQQTDDEIESELEENQAILVAADHLMDKINIALPTVRDLDASDAEMDELADLAKNSFKDLTDLALNVDPRFSGPILQSASTLLGHAITARMAKMDKKLKMVDLQLKKARLDQQAAKEESKNPAEQAVEGQGVVLDRNQMLKIILESTK
jgi:hypothetical protein